MRIVTISDTHTLHSKMDHAVPDGDILIHAGDFMNAGWDPFEYAKFLPWLAEFPHKHKILIAGNHDRWTQMFPGKFYEDVSRYSSITYLCDSSKVINKIKIYGSPWQKWFHDWAWNFPRDTLAYKKEATAIWAKIPNNTNILVTHGHPYGINDEAPDGDKTGCPHLLARISELKKLKLFVGGHIHRAHGINEVMGIKFVNASICDEDYKPVYPPIVVDL